MVKTDNWRKKSTRRGLIVFENPKRKFISLGETITASNQKVYVVSSNHPLYYYNDMYFRTREAGMKELKRFLSRVKNF